MTNLFFDKLNFDKLSFDKLNFNEFTLTNLSVYIWHMIGQTFFRCDTRGAKRREAATARSAGVDPEKQTQARRPDRRRAEKFKKKTRVGEPSAKMIKMFNAE